MSLTNSAVVVNLKINHKVSLPISSDCFQTSNSGTVIDYKNGLIITNGLILSPLFHLSNNNNSDDGFQYLVDTCFLESDVLYRGDDNDNDNHSAVFHLLDELCDVTVCLQNDLVRRNVTIPEKQLSNLLGRPLVDAAASTTRNRNKWLCSPARRQLRSVNEDSVTWKTCTAQIIAVWKNPELSNVLDTLLNPTTGWTFLETQDVASGVMSQSQSNVISNIPFHHLQEDQIRSVLSVFVLLKIDILDYHNKLDSADPYIKLEPVVPEWITRCCLHCIKSVARKSYYFLQYLFNYSISSDTLRPRQTASVVHLVSKKLDMKEILDSIAKAYSLLPSTINIGDKIHLISTPFGNLSPSVFLNSVSEGIVTNVAGCLLMTDARCVPGCEGGAMLSAADTRHRLLGVIVAPFCWRHNEWVGLTFACSLQSLLASLLKISYGPVDSMSFFSSMISDNVGLVKIGSRWGSATLVDVGNDMSSRERFFLTCSHVIQKKAGSKVKIRFVKKSSTSSCYFEAVVLYATPVGQVYDVAILHTETSNNWTLPYGFELSSRFAKEGESVRVVGHGLFDDHNGMPASVTSGVMSKILYKNGQQVLHQSTCAVHPGVSGGALVSSDSNKLLGIVVCNARDSVSGATYPHINLSIPSTILYPSLLHFAKHRDSTVFHQLQESDGLVNSFWQLGHNQLGEIKSKL